MLAENKGAWYTWFACTQFKINVYAHFTTTLVFPSAAASVIAAANPAVTTTKDVRNPWPNCLNVFFTVLVNSEYRRISND